MVVLRSEGELAARASVLTDGFGEVAWKLGGVEGVEHEFSPDGAVGCVFEEQGLPASIVIESPLECALILRHGLAVRSRGRLGEGEQPHDEANQRPKQGGRDEGKSAHAR